MVLHYWPGRIKETIIKCQSDEERTLMFSVSDVLQLPQKGTGLLYVIQPLQQDGLKTLTEMVHEGIKN